MSDETSTTDTYTVSFKSSPGYDASLVVVRGDTVGELEDNIKALHADLLSLVVDTENLLHAAYTASQPEPYQAPASQGQQEQQQSSGGGGSNVVHTCAHGKRVRREGNGKRGPWVGHFCALPKDASGKCDPVWED